MIIINRHYSDDKNDFEKLWRFLVDYYKEFEGDTPWTIGRLADWRYGLWHQTKLDPHFFEKNCQLFLNKLDELVGFAINEEGDRLFYLFSKKKYERYVLPQILEFVEREWVKEDGLGTEISDKNVYYNTLLDGNGYTKELSSQTTIYDVANFEPKYFVPEGYRIVNLKEDGNYKSKSKLLVNAFDNRELNEWDHTIHDFNRESPAYNPEFDFSVVDKDGNHVSGCVCFIDFENQYAEIEKVCTQEAHRRKGLSTALIQHAIMALKEIGIQRAEITGYSEAAQGTYMKVGPVEVVKNYKYIKMM